MKQQSGVNESNCAIQGFRYFNDTICGYGSCTSTSSHYHCLGCGFAANELHQVSNHRSTCPAPSFSSGGNYSRSLDPTIYHTNSPQNQDSSACSFYSSVYGLTQTTGPPTISPGAGQFYRTQPAVFSPYYSANSLGYDGYGQGAESAWQSMTRSSNLGSKDVDRLTSCKEMRNTKVPLPASSSCLYSQSYTTDLYSDSVLDSCYLSRNNQQSSLSRGNLGSNVSSISNQKQLPSFEPSLGFIIGPDDGMYSPAPFSFHVGSDGFTEHKASPFNDDLPSEACLGLPFPPAPPQQPPSCLLEPSADDQDSDLGSDEHEIIVEETGDDQLAESKRSCMVCTGRCGWAAVELRVDHPVTLSSHIPVWSKLTELLGETRLQPGQTLCSTCLQLLHTVDQLQAQLADATQRFLGRLHEPVLPLQPRNQNCKKDSSPHSLAVTTSNEIASEKISQLIETQEKCATELSSTQEISSPGEITKEKKEDIKLECEPCGRNFRCRRSLAIHMRRHVRQIKSSICGCICEVCGRLFTSVSNLTAHKPVCLGQFPLKCNTCGKGFTLQSKLDIHEATHQGNYPFSCEICNKGFIKTSDLIIHKRSHSGEKPYICEVCGKRFSYSGNYYHHSKLHTVKDKPFTCTICNKGFMRRTYLTVHMNRHNGTKPFTCDICNKAFPDGSNLHHHRRLHEGFKPYTCPVCGKALSSGLQAHVRTHSGERPFSCNICGQHFTANSSLKKHLKKHTEKTA